MKLATFCRRRVIWILNLSSVVGIKVIFLTILLLNYLNQSVMRKRFIKKKFHWRVVKSNFRTLSEIFRFICAWIWIFISLSTYVKSTLCDSNVWELSIYVENVATQLTYHTLYTLFAHIIVKKTLIHDEILYEFSCKYGAEFRCLRGSIVSVEC